MAGGRPKKKFTEEVEKLPSDWKDQVFSLAEKGGFDVEYKNYLRKYIGFISNDLWYRWLLEEEEFSETINIAHDLSACWWIERGRSGIALGKDFNATTYVFMSCNAHRDIFRRNRDGDDTEAKKEAKITVLNFGSESIKIEGE